MMKVALFVVAAIGLTLAEPPVSYLPPSNQYGAPGGFGSHTAAIIKPNNQYGPPSSQYGAPDGGHHQGGYNYAGNNGYNGYEDGPSEPANYNFEYHVQDNYGNDFGHQEARQGDVAQGKYFVLLPDGRRQIVEYVADQSGYKPKISYEGTANTFGAGGGYNGAGGYNGGGGYQNGGYQQGGAGGGGNAGYHY